MNWDMANGIYEEFINHVLIKGWKGSYYSYKESTRGEPITGETWIHFELINGFNLKLTCEMNGGKENISFQYWFAEEPDEKIDVLYLEQLLDLAS